MNIVIPMAGEGKRFSEVGFVTPKPLIKVNGVTLFEHSLRSIKIDGKIIVITREYEKRIHNHRIQHILDDYTNEYVEVMVSGKQLGAAATALAVKDLINNDEPLIITNCDQLLFWDSDKFMSSLDEETDGAIVLHKSYDSRNSYAIIEDGLVKKVVEKQVVSTDSLIGMHYWRHGSDFVRSAEKLVADLNGEREAYISETYNYLIEEGKIIKPYHIPNEHFISLGTPQAISMYLGSSEWKENAEYEIKQY